MFRIPIPKTGSEVLSEGVQGLLDRLIKQKEMQNEAEYRNATLGLSQQNSQMENAYKNALLKLSQQKEAREQEEQPLNLDLLKEKINAEKALAEWRKGGGSLNAGGKEEKNFLSLIAKDNPHLSPDQIYEASNVLREGGNKLNDGTQLKPLSPAAVESLNRITKYGTYAGAAVPLLKANQAEAELHTITSMANKDFEPYATTYAGYSIPQIISTFKNDDKSQIQLGNFIASQAAQYEAAQIRNRIAGGEPGITATQELMGKSGQIIKTLYPRLSAKARMQATKRLDEYLEAGLKSRKSVGIGASTATSKKYNNNESEEMVTLTNPKTKETITIPLSEARTRGFKG